MTLSKYLNKNELEFYTVNELYADLEMLIESGLGDRIVMIENCDMDHDADYRFINKHIRTNDSEEKCIYLDLFTNEEDDHLADMIF